MHDAHSPDSPGTLVLTPSATTGGAFSRALLAGMALLLLAAAAMPFDLDLSHALRGKWIGGDLKRLILLAEVYAHGTGVAMILLTIFVLDIGSRRYLLRLALCTFGAGLGANLVKMCVARIRPHSLPEGAGVAETFVAWFPLVTQGNESFTSAMQSFPSAHTATAVGLAIGMSRLYPRGRWLFVLFAGLAALQRIITGAHYPSDVLCGAAVGCVVAGLLIDARIGGRLFDRFERRNLRDTTPRESVRSAA